MHRQILMFTLKLVLILILLLMPTLILILILMLKLILVQMPTLTLMLPPGANKLDSTASNAIGQFAFRRTNWAYSLRQKLP